MSADIRSYNRVVTGSPFSFTSSVDETTLLTITPTQNMGFKGLWLDLSNLVQTATIRSKYDMNNNSTYITFDTIIYTPTGINNSILIGQKCPLGYKIRFTIQSLVAEGSSKNIPFEYFFWNLSSVNE